MSRYTRMLRKQAKAAAKTGHKGTFSHGKTSIQPRATLDGSPSDGVSAYVIAAGTNGSLVLHPLDVDHPSVHTCSENYVNKYMPLPVAPTNADIAPPSPRETAAASPPSPTNLLLDNTPSSGGAAGETRPVTVNGSPQTTRPHPISPHLEGWIWPGKIRTGELVVLVGESGAGASTVTSDWIARLTRGMSFPGCRPQDHHPVAEVLLFNSLEDYSRTVLPRLAEMGGDPGKVLLASDQLLAWGAGEIPGDQPPLEGREAQTRVRLHTAAALEKLDQLLKRRPNIRLVVIDQLKLFLRTDSERVFEGLIQELTAIARTNDVTLVLTQGPDAFRKSGGPARYLKSPSLVQCARSIWRVVASEEGPFGDRVLDCLKMSHPVRKEKPGPWHLRLPAFGPLEWVRGNGGALLASTATSHEQALKTACRMVERVLQVNEGKTTWDVLVHDANSAGIELRWLREAIYKMKLESAFDLQQNQQQMVRHLGYAEEMVLMQNITDMDNSPSHEDLPLYQQRQLDPPLRWGDERPTWEERFAEAAQETSRIPHQNVFPDDLAVQDETGPHTSDELAEVPAAGQAGNRNGETTAAPTGEGPRFIKPKVTSGGDQRVASRTWDASTDLEEGADEDLGWNDEVANPTGHLTEVV